ncbi:PqqD family peptide modification chaperone [Emticicia fontis]
MSIFSMTSIVRRKDANTIITNLGDELVMMHVESGNFITLNNLGRVIWEKIEHPLSIGDLINYLLSKYNVSETQCKEETVIFLEKLNAEHLLA